MDVTAAFEAEAERLRRAGVAGASGRVRDLFDWLVARGPEAEPATQEEIARAVFGQQETDADDATVRVYMHRLRKKIDDYYSRHPAPESGKLEIPSGVYALQLHAIGVAATTMHGGMTGRLLSAAVGALAALALATLAMLFILRPTAPNAIWAPIAHSDRPVLLVLGDYYLFGEIDPVRPEMSRLIRDFRVDAPDELYALQEAEPGRYGMAEDVGLNYLPFSSAYGLLEVLPLLTEMGEEVTVIPASAVEPDMLNYYDVVYVGLLSGMHVLEEQTFRESTMRLGESYDEIIDRDSGQSYVSSEARSLPSPAFYEDYAYLARFTAPTGAQVVVVASERDTGLRGISPVVAGRSLPQSLSDVAAGEGFDALFRVTGQQGADLADSVLVARARP